MAAAAHTSLERKACRAQARVGDLGENRASLGRSVISFRTSVTYHHASLAIVRSFEAGGIDELRSELPPPAQPV